MKLIIRRNQSDVKGLLGGHKGVRFSLYARAEIDSNERSLIERYKVGGHTLATYQQMKHAAPLHIQITVSSLVDGRTIEMDDISTLLELEEAIKSGCQNLKTLLAVMSTFGGEETVAI